MKRTAKIAQFLLAAAFLLLSCQISGTATPAGSTQPASGPTAVPPNTYINTDNGISVAYPPGWKTQNPEADSSALTMFVSPDSSVRAMLYVFSASDTDSTQSTAEQIADEAMTGLEDTQTVSSEAFAFTDNTLGWRVIATGVNTQGAELKVSIVVGIYGSRVYLMIAFGATAAYDYYSDDIDSLSAAMRFESPVVNGVSRATALFLSGGESTNPRTYDPATTHGSGDKMAYSGLVSFDPNLNLVPEIAESWTVSADGMVYTFHLRANAKFHDGRAVTAQDFIYSWERAADPATESDTVLTYLGDIVGVKEMHSGEADHISGLAAVDNRTLQVTIDAPKPYFLLKLTYPTAFVLDRANVESGAEWYRQPNGTGPYKLTEWVSFDHVTYQANPDFYLGEPSIKTIVVKIYSGVGIRLYESGEIDITSVSSYNVPRVLDPAEPLNADVHSAVNLCTSYVAFDSSQPPFDDPKVRQAFTMAFDRQKYIDVVYNGVGIPAKGLYPPALPGYSLNAEGLPYDPARARQLLAESKYGGPAGLPPIVFTDAGIGNDASESVAAMAQMWEQNLDVTITIENLDPNNYSDLLYAGKHGQMFDYGWCADYPDPENFADVLFHTGSEQNLGNYSNPALDAILEQARTEQDVAKRIALYQQAEQMLIQDAAALFTRHSISYVLVKPYVIGYVLTPIDIPLERYLSIRR
ncbi:MAG: peptide/nickel transport system substrate-binding protein [Anaerolineaceae bacterium]|nr:MAG: peptide/nickel transport system substrate-binding protein [Anaerolineaceae bacterium]